jgi:Ca2+-binding RTX toxin-like protein
MRTGRSYVATAVALGIITLSGCAAETADEGSKVGKDEDWGDENKYPEIGGSFHSLTAFVGTCTFANGLMTVSAADAVQSIIVGKRAVDSAIVVNGAQLANCTTATSATVKQLKISATTGTANQTVIIDFLGGTFAPGIAAARGIIVDLGGGTGDEVRVRGTSAADSWVFGSDGFAHNTDAFRDIDFVGVETYNFATAGGNDTFTASVVPLGLGAGKGVAASALVSVTVFGGDGNDVLTGGERGDKIFGGNGADTLAGGAGNVDKDRLFGEAGADVFTQGDANNGRDDIFCGTEAVIDPDAPVKDTVTYALRGTAAVRDKTSAATILATDGERVQVTLGDFVDSLVNATGMAGTDGIVDLDAEGYPVYAANDGHTTEAANVLTVTELDAISQDCEVVVGGMDNDVLTGSALADTISGGPGDDLIVGGLLGDVLNGDDGDDKFDDGTIVGSTGADVFNGGLGTDTVSYLGRTTTGVTVTMDGVDADDGQSSEGDNVKADVENLVGTLSVDDITGNKLNNVLTGGLAADKLHGEDGNDTFFEEYATNGGDTFEGGAGVDTVDYSHRTATGVWVTMAGEVANDGAGTLPTRSVGTQALILGLEAVASAGTSTEADNVLEDVENVLGSQVADDITGNAEDNSLDGGGGADFLFGGAGDDTLYGGGDLVAETVTLVDWDGDGTAADAAITDTNDYLYGGEGDDILDGGATVTSDGNKLVCGEGSDSAYNQGTVTFVPTSGVGAFRHVDSCES